MSLESVFLNLVRGSRLSMYMGLKMDEGAAYRFAKDYTYIEIPLAQLYNPSTEEVVTKATRNQRIQIIPACKVEIKGNYKILIKTNPVLQEVASCPSMILLDSGEAAPASFYATFHKDMSEKDLEWAVRLYLLPA
jgi:hypothetical protein